MQAKADSRQVQLFFYEDRILLDGYTKTTDDRLVISAKFRWLPLNADALRLGQDVLDLIDHLDVIVDDRPYTQDREMLALRGFKSFRQQAKECTSVVVDYYLTRPRRISVSRTKKNRGEFYSITTGEQDLVEPSAWELGAAIRTAV